MTQVYVGNLDPLVTGRDLEDEFHEYGALRNVWVSRRPVCFAFVEFEERRDALNAIRVLDGRHGWRVKLSYNFRGGGRGGRGRGRGRGVEDMKCFQCGEPGHFARECRVSIGPGGLGSGRHRSPCPPRYRRSPSYGRRSSSPRGRRSPHRRSNLPYRGRSYRRSLPYRRQDSPYARSPGMDRRRSYSPRRAQRYSRSAGYHREDFPQSNRDGRRSRNCSAECFL